MPNPDLSALFADLPDHDRLWLALSGGLDSVVLLDLAVTWCLQQTASRQKGLQKKKSLQVLHVHHGLSPHADQWADHCLALCRGYEQQYDLPVHCQVHKVTLNPKASLEAQARAARYRVFEHQLQKGDLLLMAHHADDQLETLLLRLMRGAGNQGLSGIPAYRSLGQGALYRPLLPFERADLEQYALARKLSWVEDESNQSLRFDRNFLRHNIVPQLKQRWPQASAVAGRSAGVLAENARLNDALAEIDLQQVASSDRALSCTRLLQFPPERQRNLLRFWLLRSGVAAPDYRHLEVILRELVQAGEDAQPHFSRRHFTLRRYRDQLLLQIDPQKKLQGRLPSDAVSSDAAALSGSIANAVLDLPVRQAEYFALDQIGFYAEPAAYDAESRLYLPVEGCLTLEARAGGETLRLPGRGRKTLKKLLQESGVPAWLRDQVRVFWLTCNGAAPRLVGAWSPMLPEAGSVRDKTNRVSEPGASASPGVFWWDECLVAEPETAQASHRVILRRVSPAAS